MKIDNIMKKVSSIENKNQELEHQNQQMMKKVLGVENKNLELE